MWDRLLPDVMNFDKSSHPAVTLYVVSVNMFYNFIIFLSLKLLPPLIIVGNKCYYCHE